MTVIDLCPECREKLRVILAELEQEESETHTMTVDEIPRHTIVFNRPQGVNMNE